MTHSARELQQLAQLYGVVTSYEDVHRRRQTASVGSLLEVLRALGAAVESPNDAAEAVRCRRQAMASRGIEPVIVVWDGRSRQVPLIVPVKQAAGTAKCTVHLDGEVKVAETPLRGSAPHPDVAGFATVTVPLPAALPPGYHELTVETARATFESLIISAPKRTYSVAGEERLRRWGCFLPLYALRTDNDWGMGDFTGLGDVSAWVCELGGRLVGTLPMLAAFLDDPCEPSPYAPVSRLFWNELYIDVSRVPELRDSPSARQIVESANFQRELEIARQSDLVDYRRSMSLKRRVLERLAETLYSQRDSARYEAHARFLEQQPRVRDYAAFRAACERFGRPWREWHAARRDGDLTAEDYDPQAADYHAYVQWIAHEQIADLARRTGEAGDGIYLDLPLGVLGDGYDVWRHRRVYATAATVGAPPDAVFTKGQDWSFPPLHPEEIRRDGYRHVRDYLSHHMQFAGTLRIDHVMGLHRLYWIPRGLPASQGVYVRYRPEEFYAVLSLESHRHRTTLVGEDLGTVPKEVNRGMARHGVRRMYVVQYELESHEKPPLDDIPADCIASLNTHDMPTFAAWWLAEDVPDRQQLGLMSDAEAKRELRKREQLKRRLVKRLERDGYFTGASGRFELAQVVVACLSRLAASPAEAVLLNLEDLWLETRPQNVPGTGAERPNWRRKAEFSFEEFRQIPAVADALCRINQLRREVTS